MWAWKPKSRDPRVASVRYRCLIPLGALRRRGLPITLFDERDVDEYEGVIFSKSYDEADRSVARRLRSRGRASILDLCDNHFYNPYALPFYETARQSLLEMIGLCDRVVCSTETLAGIVSNEARLEIRPLVVGDPVERFAHSATRRGQFRLRRLGRIVPLARRRLLWFGIHGSPNAPCGMADIASVAEPLEAAGRETPFVLVVCSDSREEFDRRVRPLPCASSYVEYDVASFPRLLSSADGVILPIGRNPFTLAKSHNRLTTALIAGVPVVADGIPSYREFADFCHLDEWSRGLREILQEPRTARRRAAAARPYIDTNWNLDRVADSWAAAIGLRPR